MKKILCIVLALLMLAGVLCSCEDKKNDLGLDNESEETKKGKWQIGVHEVVIDSAWLEAGNLFVKYIFTNNGDQPTSLLFEASTDAFQNGIQLEQPFGYANDSGSITEIKPGYSIEVIEKYYLKDETADIEVEVREMAYSSPDVVTRTFKMSDLLKATQEK